VLLQGLALSARGSSSTYEGMTGGQLNVCQAGEGIGKGMVLFLLLLLWGGLVDVILGVIYLVTRRTN
jgi:hypothetical protein